MVESGGGHYGTRRLREPGFLTDSRDRETLREDCGSLAGRGPRCCSAHAHRANQPLGRRRPQGAAQCSVDSPARMLRLPLGRDALANLGIHCADLVAGGSRRRSRSRNPELLGLGQVRRCPSNRAANDDRFGNRQPPNAPLVLPDAPSRLSAERCRPGRAGCVVKRRRSRKRRSAGLRLTSAPASVLRISVRFQRSRPTAPSIPRICVARSGFPGRHPGFQPGSREPYRSGAAGEGKNHRRRRM